ncbi:MAG TPA: hypothetical protein VH583_20720 [Vicinamibacterales bacterium]|jgi:hypothetical protein
MGRIRFVVLIGLAAAAGWIATPAAQTDLDAFMREVLARRDENWKKQQQYVLDEREQIDLRGPGQTPVWGERRDYTWFIRDGFFVRSPVKVNGVTVGEADRRKYETEYLNRQQRRERRRNGGQTDVQTDEQAPTDVEGLLRQTREPQFVSSAYFLRFRFEEGKYALVGREKLGGSAPIDVLRIEYYPTNLFRGTDRRRERSGATDEDRAYDAEFRRLMNKTALVTLWVEPKAHQIVKYTFDNIAFDFLPMQWLVHIDELHASMTMAQAFPDVWLPNHLDFQGAMTMAAGQFDLRYGVEYHDYRRADVTTKVTIPKDR